MARRSLAAALAVTEVASTRVGEGDSLSRMAIVPDQMSSVAEFLAWERRQDQRYEFIDGLVRAMAGGTVDHNTIVLNVVAGLRAALHGSGCRVFAENVKVIVDGAALYPDVVVTCAPVEPKADCVEQPTLVVEVLSGSTEAYDRGRKREAYQRLASLRHYLLISQDQAHIELYSRDRSRGWSAIEVTGLAAAVELEACRRTLALADVFASSSVAEAAA